MSYGVEGYCHCVSDPEEPEIMAMGKTSFTTEKPGERWLDPWGLW